MIETICRPLVFGYRKLMYRLSKWPIQIKQRAKTHKELK